MALTDNEIKRAKGAHEPYRLPDAGGLYVRITPSGGKLWRWKYRFEGKQKLMTLGKYPDVSLALARERPAESDSGRSYRSHGTEEGRQDSRSSRDGDLFRQRRGALAGTLEGR